MHDTELIATIAGGLSVAFVFGLIAARFRLPLIVGYLLAGVAIGPFTPGFVADESLAPQLAEVGVILLMFGVGIHFSLRDLMKVKAIAVPGAVVQVGVATMLGILLTSWWGWSLGSGIVLGLALSVASTVVLLRAMTARDQLETVEGTVAVGWLLVEDLIMVFALVLLPAFAGALGGIAQGSGDSSLAFELLVTFGKVGVFVALMLVVGVRLVPRVLFYVQANAPRELFTLATLALAIGIAYLSSELFGVSFALGAFLAGMVVNESEYSHRAAQDALPLREAFSVLFFVSVGMLIDPGFLISEFDKLAGVLAIVLVGKALTALVIVRALGGRIGVGLTVAAGLSQVGEFSFILAGLGRELDLLSIEGQKLVLSAALVSITLNPLLFVGIDWVKRMLEERTSGPRSPEPALG